jgi:hypothetical protein
MKDGCNNYEKMTMGLNFKITRVSFWRVLQIKSGSPGK